MTEANINHEQILEVELDCVVCGKGLKGELIEGACGGCGAAVKRCLGDENLIFCDETKLKRLNRALKLLMISPLPGLIAFYVMVFFSIQRGGYQLALQLTVMGGILLLSFWMGYVTFCATQRTDSGKIAKRSLVWRLGLWLGFFSTMGLGLYLGFALTSGGGNQFFNLAQNSRFFKMMLYLVLPFGVIIYWASLLMRYGCLAHRLGRKNTGFGATLVATLAAFMYVYWVYVILHTFFFEIMISKQDLMGLIIGWSSLLIASYVAMVHFQILINHSMDWGKVLRRVVDEDGVMAERPMVGDREMGLAIEFDCDGCGYNLKSVPLKGNCPECGYGISETLSATNFMFSCDRWRRRLASGLWMFMILPAFFLVLNYTLLAGGPWGSERYDGRDIDRYVASVKEHETFTMMLNFGLGVVYFSVLTWFVTSLEPHVTKTKGHQITRLVMWFILILFFLFGFIFVVRDGHWGSPADKLWKYWYLMIACYIIAFVWRYMRFSKRMHHDRLTSSGYSQFLLQGLIMGACLLGIVDGFTGKHINSMIAKLGFIELNNAIILFCTILFSLSVIHFSFYCVFQLIRTNESINKGLVRRPFLPESVRDDVPADEACKVETDGVE